MKPTLLASGAVAIAVAACGAPSATTNAPTRELVVAAAASLTDAFEDIAAAFEVAHPEIDVVLDLAGSSTLREQILAGAPVAVFASADTRDLRVLADAGLLTGASRTFARNELAIVVPAGNPAGVAGLADFAHPDLFVGLCAPQVPCGRLALEVLGRAGISPSLDTEEPDVRALVTKVAAGELDLAMAYASDVVAADGTIETVPVPADANVSVDYPIASLAAAGNAEAAQAFVDFVLGDDGQSILREHGFQGP